MFQNINKRGFTLIELLVVISIIGALAGLFGVSAPRIQRMAYQRRAQSEIQALELAIKQYSSDFGIHPDDASSRTVVNPLTGYNEFPDKPDPMYKNNPDWSGPYFEAKKKQFSEGKLNGPLLDPWQTEYKFNLSDPQNNHYTFDIWSAGPDRKDDKGGNDDIKNW